MSDTPRKRGRPRQEVATVQVAVRLEPALLEQIDQYAENLTNDRGLKVTRSNAVRSLLS